MGHRRYTQQQKMAAVAEASINGAEQAASATGIPRTTILYWLDKPEFVELRQKTREEMRDGFKVLVHKAQERLTDSIGTMEPRDLTILLGVATDKTLLLSGDPTSRSEVSSFHGYNDHEKRLIADVLRQAIAGDGAPASPAGDAGGDAVDSPSPEGAATS